MCVKGKCVRTGCDGIIGSKLQYDKCGICGGDSTGCIRVVGNFTKKRYGNGGNKPGKERDSSLLSVLSAVRATLMW